MRNKFGKTSNVKRTINAEISDQAPKPKLPITVEVEIGPESAWIYLEADGVIVHKGTMLPGARKLISAKEDILLTTANAGSTGVVYNGKNLGKLGRAGEVVRNVEFTSE